MFNRKIIVSLALTTAAILSGCSADLSEEQKVAAANIQRDGMSQDDAECIAGKLSGSALDKARLDSDFSELSGEDGGKVAAAWSECTGQDFRTVHHYDPARYDGRVG